MLAFIFSPIYEEKQGGSAAHLIVTICRAITQYAEHWESTTPVGGTTRSNLGTSAITTRDEQQDDFTDLTQGQSDDTRKQETMECLQYIPKWLWSALVVGPSTTVRITEDRDAAEWLAICQSKHLSHISKTEARQQQPPTLSATDITRIIQASVHAGTAGGTTTAPCGAPQAKVEKDPRELLQTALGDAGALTILRASEPWDENTFDDDGIDISGCQRDSPVPTLAQLLKALTNAHAATLINIMMRDNLKCSVVLPPSIIGGIRAGQFIWPKANIAGPFSTFSCGPDVEIRYIPGQRFTHDDAIISHLDATEGRGLTEQQTKKAGTVIHMIPKSMNELILHIKHFGGLCSIIFGNNSKITKLVRTTLDHTINNWGAYETITNNNIRNSVLILAGIDNVVQTYLKRCENSNFTQTAECDTCTWFQSQLNQIVWAKHCPFTWIPVNIEHMMNRQKQPPTNQNPNTPGTTQRGSTNDNQANKKARLNNPIGNKVMNTNQVPKHAEVMKTQGQFGKFCKLARTKPPPIVHDTALCINYWVKGSCHSLCVRKASHTTTLPNEALAWINKIIKEIET